MSIKIDGNEIDSISGVNTLGELIAWVEKEYLLPGRCITRVMLSGEESLNYRAEEIAKQAAASMGGIEIETGNFDEVVRKSLSELDSELKTAVIDCGEIVRLLENRKEEDGYLKLAALLDAIRIFFSIFSEDLGWAEAAEGEASRREFADLLDRALAQLITAQENRYWVSVCDVLEYEITPILEGWAEIVRRTQAAKAQS